MIYADEEFYKSKYLLGRKPIICTGFPFYARQASQIIDRYTLDRLTDLAEVPENILARLEVRPVRWIDQVLEIALQTQPAPKVRDTAEPDEAVAVPEPAAKTGGVLDGVRAH